MKNLIALTIVAMMSAPSYAVMVGSGNNMGQEPLPRDARETNAGMTDTNRRNYDVDTTRNDTISTGQSATRRDNNSSVSNQSASTCVDKNGYTYYRNDSGFASCVNQSSSKMRSR